ncbi:MAG: symmetrical bis(5'-nucleosyl)-tetraphosphatase [Proteobacteria bacterium]|nr:symmetrical bis(5'-nucleosyl)-tetraphosphatase [Pseudomonadota bacterium]
MTRYAIGDIQGCERELQALLKQARFSADRDQLWLVGDLVNRGPGSLAVLRFVRSLGDNAIVVLGNHDLHLLALAHGCARQRKSDTLAQVLGAPDREVLLEWLMNRPLAYAQGQDLLVHAGVVPQWSVAQTLELAGEVSRALLKDPRTLFAHMYGDEPDLWDERLTGMARLRFTINVLTRIRVCDAAGRVDLTMKGPPPPASSGWRPWFDHPQRKSRDARILFGHWSALGLVRRAGVIGLDSGCAWGGTLTAYDLDREREPLATRCAQYQAITAD